MKGGTVQKRLIEKERRSKRRHVTVTRKRKHGHFRGYDVWKRLTVADDMSRRLSALKRYEQICLQQELLEILSLEHSPASIEPEPTRTNRPIRKKIKKTSTSRSTRTRSHQMPPSRLFYGRSPEEIITGSAPKGVCF